MNEVGCICTCINPFSWSKKQKLSKKEAQKNVDQVNLIKTVETLLEQLNNVWAFRSKN